MPPKNFDQYLMADHRVCDQLLGAARRHAVAGEWDQALTAATTLQHDVLAHFAAEEEILFPAFEAASGMTCGPTQVMRMEHAEARDLLEDLLAAATDKDADGVRGHAEVLLIHLQQHNMKEENILYPASVDALGSQVAELSAQIAARREAV